MRVSMLYLMRYPVRLQLISFPKEEARYIPYSCMNDSFTKELYNFFVFPSSLRGYISQFLNSSIQGYYVNDSLNSRSPKLLAISCTKQRQNLAFLEPRVGSRLATT